MSAIHYLDWPAPENVKACFTTREGGFSQAPFDYFNLALHVDDDPVAVTKNRTLLSEQIHQTHIHWLQQTHSTIVVDIEKNYRQPADASIARCKNEVCCVMTADCLPVFFCDKQGQQVAVAHAGWRGLCDGVLQNTLAMFSDTTEVLAYLGPAISQAAFEVGDDVRDAFLQNNSDLDLSSGFLSASNEGKWMTDLYQIASLILKDKGVGAIYGGDRCTYTEKDTFFSYRRDGKTGRMANLIWME